MQHMMTKKTQNHVYIDLGNNVLMRFPFKKRWDIEEWRRMTAYVESCVGTVQPERELKERIKAFK